MTALKTKIYKHYHEALLQKIAILQQKLEDLSESLKQETKSTAGDKYETGRAMVHIEQENTTTQLATLQQQKAELESIDILSVHEQTGRGSLVKTTQGYFFISTALGKAVIDDITVYALSPQSPLGQQFMGLKAGARARLNTSSYDIEEVC